MTSDIDDRFAAERAGLERSPRPASVEDQRTRRRDTRAALLHPSQRGDEAHGTEP